MPNVSVIIPVYNTEKYLRRCLDSVCNQTLKDIEIICVNDASSDDSAAILAGYAGRDPRVKVIAFEQNRGAAAARNAGLDVASGTYVGFVDSDDFVDPDFYGKLVDTGDDVALGNLVEERYDANGKVVETINARIYRDLRREALEYKVGFRGIFPVAIYRRDLIRASGIRFAEGRTVGEDRLFPLMAGYRARTVGAVDDTFYHYRCRANSATRRTMTRRDVEGMLAYVEDVAGFLRHHRLSMRDRFFLVNQTFLGIFHGPVLSSPFVEDALRVAESFYGEFRETCDYRRSSVSAIIESVRCGRGFAAAMGRLTVDGVCAKARREMKK